MVGVYCDSAAPVQCDEVPCQRAGYGADMDEAWGRAVAEICTGEVEEVDDEEELCEPKVRAHPEVHEAEEKEVVGDEVGAYVCGGVDVVNV